MELQEFKDILTKAGFKFSNMVEDAEGFYNMEDWIKRDIKKERILTVRICNKIDNTEDIASISVYFTNPDKWTFNENIGINTKGYSTFIMSLDETVEKINELTIW